MEIMKNELPITILPLLLSTLHATLLRLISKLVLDSAHLVLRRPRMDRPEIDGSTSQVDPWSIHPPETSSYVLYCTHLNGHAIFRSIVADGVLLVLLHAINTTADGAFGLKNVLEVLPVLALASRIDWIATRDDDSQ